MNSVFRSALTDSTDEKVWRSPIVFSGTCVKANRSGKCGEITLWHIFKGDEQLTSTVSVLSFFIKKKRGDAL